MKAVYLAQEGLEAARSIRNSAFTNLTDGTFGLGITSNRWTLTGANDVVDSIYTRQIQVSSINSTTKQVVATVSWTGTPGGSVSFTSRLIDIARSIPIGDWSSILQTSTLNLAGTGAGLKIRISGDYAYIVKNDSGSNNFLVLNISNPASVTAVGALNLNGSPTNLVISGNYALVTTNSDTRELQIVNITTPTAPTLTSFVDLSGSADAFAVWVSGTRAFVTRAVSSSTELDIVDFSTPSLPIRLSGVNLTSPANAIYMIGDYVYLGTTSTTSELQIVNASVILVPVLSASYNLTAATAINSLDSSATNTLLAGGADGNLYALSISSPTAPTLLGSVALGGAVNDIAVDTANALAFTATANSTNELRVVNVATLSAMTIPGSLNTTVTPLNGIIYDSLRSRVYAVGTTGTAEFVGAASN
jgi:hypothetical protein